ncbi:MAG: hydroxymethylglutaryl-CoA reductase, degradative [Flavobacteriaceae bacterium]|nr:hydroxymethylglutaryl-CoA reductase, degradative [Flavobacteriaceae bacterium]
MNLEPVQGFSKLSKTDKIAWLVKHYSKDAAKTQAILEQYHHVDTNLQQLHDEFIENTISNYFLPLGVAPNFLINERLYAIPMAIEESSVVAAASKAAKFWLKRGGFRAEVLDTQKVGQVHFLFEGEIEKLQTFFEANKKMLLDSLAPLTKNMKKRGGGILDMQLVDKTAALPHYFQLHLTFETLDAMGANFINSCLEQLAATWRKLVSEEASFAGQSIEIVMSILSNYVPDCVVRASVSCPVEALGDNAELGKAFAEKFVKAIRIAEVEPYRAVTHNKGIMNGVDAVILATGNDFRAIEAGAHAYAAKDGRYTSLTHAKIEGDQFRYWIEMPLALGTVGGLTKLHPLVKEALVLLQEPSAKELMQIVAVAGLAQNFAAVHSLVTSGIQRGHMKMHLMNMLNQMQATADEKLVIAKFFENKTITHAGVVEAIEKLRLGKLEEIS